MKFEILVNTIKQTHQHFQQQATKAVNVSLTLRNWLIGYYIVEYEQMGEDRAKYGERLVDSLAEKLNNKGLGNRNLKLFRQFYLAYPELNTVIAQLTNLPGKSLPEIMQLSTAQFSERNECYLLHLVHHVSFTHFVELIKIQDKTKRVFFELLIIKTTPNVQELKRQISTLAFERVGLSVNNELAFKELQSKIVHEQPSDAIKSVYAFDFLGLKTTGLVEEHEYLSQLNSYVSFYREEMKRTDDNNPVGILLCTEKGQKLVEYALSGMDEKLFVSKYLLQLPQKELLQNFIQNELAKWNK